MFKALKFSSFFLNLTNDLSRLELVFCLPLTRISQMPPFTTIGEFFSISRNAQRQAAQLPKQLKETLKRLKNLLKLPKARRWVYCEFFYSDIDRELLLSESEFRLCLRESFPNLKTRNLTRTEWRKIRRLIGKPRRCSQAFFDEERQVLEQKRRRIRDIYKGFNFFLLMLIC